MNSKIALKNSQKDWPIEYEPNKTIFKKQKGLKNQSKLLRKWKIKEY